MKTWISKIESYLGSTMEKKDKALFEKELAENPELKKAAIRRSLGLSENTAEDEPAREIIGRLQLQAGPLPTPMIPLQDKARYFFLDRSKVLRVAAIAILLIGIPIVWSQSLPSLNAVIEQNALHPDVGDTAGEQPDIQTLKQKAALIYGRVTPGGSEALTQLAGKADSFNIANFYLAHWYLEEKEYTRAEAELEKCILHRSELDEFDRGYIEMAKFNLILAHLGRSAPKKQILSELSTFLAEFPDHANAIALQRELNRPVRKLFGY